MGIILDRLADEMADARAQALAQQLADAGVTPTDAESVNDEAAWNKAQAINAAQAQAQAQTQAQGNASDGATPAPLVATVAKGQGVLKALTAAGVPDSQLMAAYGQIYRQGQLQHFGADGNAIVQPGQKLQVDLNSLGDDDHQIGVALVTDAGRKPPVVVPVALGAGTGSPAATDSVGQSGASPGGHAGEGPSPELSPSAAVMLHGVTAANDAFIGKMSGGLKAVKQTEQALGPAMHALTKPAEVLNFGLDNFLGYRDLFHHNYKSAAKKFGGVIGGGLGASVSAVTLNPLIVGGAAFGGHYLGEQAGDWLAHRLGLQDETPE